MKNWGWSSLAIFGPGIITRFVLAFRLPPAERSAALAKAIVEMWQLIDQLLPQRTSEARMKWLVGKYLPLIAAEFQPQDSSLGNA